VVGAIGPARNGIPTAELEIGAARIAGQPETRCCPISWPCGLEERLGLDDLGNPLREGAEVLV
jgi:hypothetical protein